VCKKRHTLGPSKQHAWPLNSALTIGNKMSLNKYLILIPLLFSTSAYAKDIDLKLFNAALRGELINVKLLLKSGANIETSKNSIQATPLNAASQSGHIDVVKYLISKGASVNSVDGTGSTPLYLASDMGHYEIVKLLLKAKANVNKIHNKSGASALTMAVDSGNKKICDLLIKNGAEINSDGNDKMSPLFMAVLRGNIDMVKYLLSKGADPNQHIMIENNKISMTYVAERKGFSEIKDLLNKYGKI